MLKHLTLAAMLACTPTLALAQSPAPDTRICDGSVINRYDRARHIAGALYAATAAADFLAIVTVPRTPNGFGAARSHFAFVAATAPVAFGGFLIARNAYPGEKFWQRVIPSLKVGETRAADVELCLHRPAATTTSATEQRWTYVITRPSVFATSLSTLHLTFRDSVLADVQRTEVNRDVPTMALPGTIGVAERRHGFCTPPTTVVADPFPTPTDSTPGAAAMARAQADAEAASKNAALFAAYAACMASDTAQ